MSSATGFRFSYEPATELYDAGPQTYGVLVSSPEEKVSNPFYFEDTQVVLQASHDITSYYPYIH